MKEIMYSKINRVFQKHKILLVYLFGSQVKGSVGKLSDVDIAVLFEKEPSLNKILELIGDLKEVLKRDDVDVVSLNTASPLLKNQAVIHGKLIYFRDKNQVADFTKQVLEEYEDAIFLRQSYYKYLENRVFSNKLGENLYVR